MDERERREAVRRAYGYRCGYCGVHEEEAGSKLEIDHFRPRSAGGGDELDNLVYCIEWLRLNRPPLVALRRTRREVASLRRDLAAAREEQARLQERIRFLERELENVLEQLLRLLGS